MLLTKKVKEKNTVQYFKLYSLHYVPSVISLDENSFSYAKNNNRVKVRSDDEMKTKERKADESTNHQFNSSMNNIQEERKNT